MIDIDSSPIAKVRADCCVCEGHHALPVGVGSDFEYHTSADTYLAMRCSGCGLVFLDPRPADSELNRIYPDDYHAFDFSEEDFGLVHKIRSRLEARRLLRWCSDLPGNARILDIGCGDGFHLDLLKRFGAPGWQLQGVDTNEAAIEVAMARGLNVTAGKVESLDRQRIGFDLILLIMTIEHVGDPRSMLGEAHRLLRPGGRLVVVTDNSSSLDARLFRGGFWGGYHFPRHWHLFDRRSLGRLAELTGFEVASLKTAMSPVNWVYSIHNMLVAMKAPAWMINRFTLHSVVSLSFFTGVDTLLNMLGRGSILHGIFRKRDDSVVSFAKL